MKNLSPALQTHLQGDSLTLARCMMVERVDGTRLGFTDHPRDLLVDMGTGNGKETFAGAGGFNSTAHAGDVGLSADTVSLLGVIDDVRITESDLKGGKYVGAQVWVFDVNYVTPDDGVIQIDYGVIGDIEINDQTWVANTKSIAELLSQTMGEKYGRYCRATLGDANCKIVLDPLSWQATTAYIVGDLVKATAYDARRYRCTTAGTSGATEPIWDTTIGNPNTDGSAEWETLEAWTKQGTVTGVTDRQSFSDSARIEPADWFRQGVVTWKTGQNAGLSQQVKTNDAVGNISLLHPMPFDIAGGDTFDIVAGCNHLLKLPGDVFGTPYTGDCRSKFDNVVNFQGEADMPGDDQLTRGPG